MSAMLRRMFSKASRPSHAVFSPHQPTPANISQSRIHPSGCLPAAGTAAGVLLQGRLCAGTIPPSSAWPDVMPSPFSASHGWSNSHHVTSWSQYSVLASSTKGRRADGFSTSASKEQDSPPKPPASLPLQFCVVGSGPAGFYTADKLLKAFPSGTVTMVDRLPSPFGLVRTGVAPDHPDVKFVTNQFTRLLQSQQPRLSYLGHVTLGRDVSLVELRPLFHAVVLAYGAEGDKRLGIPGEDLGNFISAREFVWWYNGHPEYVNLPVDLKSSDTAVVLGQGNVALDCARILLRPREELEETDIAEHAMEALRESTIRKVHLVGRRGPAQAACTAKEVRELQGLRGVAVTADPQSLPPSPVDLEEMKRSRGRRRVHELISKSADPSTVPHGSKEINWMFFRSPKEILPSATKTEGGNPKEVVGGVRLELTRLTGGGEGKDQRAVGTGVEEDLPCGLVLRSIGYRSVPVEGLPFDTKTGTVPNIHGRALRKPTIGGEHVASTGSECGDYEPGLYVVGWLKRGPTGIIGTNEIDATDTVESIVHDAEILRRSGEGSKVGGKEALEALLSERGVRFVDFDDWLRIDWEERRLGKNKGKLREKFVSVKDMLHIAGK